MEEFLKILVEDNLSIAKYMGWDKHPSPSNTTQIVKYEDERWKWKYIKSLDYHTSWDSLMGVINTIEDTEHRIYDNDSVGSYIDFHIMPDAILVCHSDNEDEPLVLINKSEGKGSIETEPILFEDKFLSLYTAVVIIVKWLNENKK